MSYPIATVDKRGVNGGFGAGLSSANWFRWNVASYYLKGGFDDTRFYDSEGGRYSVKTIELSKPTIWQYLYDRVAGLVIWGNGRY